MKAKLVKVLNETHRVLKYSATFGGKHYKAFSPLVDNAGRMTLEGEYKTGIPAGKIVNREDAIRAAQLEQLLGRRLNTEI